MSRHKRQRPTLADLSQPGPALSPADLAHIVGLSREQIAEMCRLGELNAFRPAGSTHWKIHRTAALDYCKRNRIAA